MFTTRLSAHRVWAILVVSNEMYHKNNLTPPPVDTQSQKLGASPQRPPGRKSRVDLTQGPIAAKLFSLAAPLVAGNILQTVYNLVDMFWVGRLGAEAVAAVSIVFPTEWLLISIAMGVTIA